MSSEMMSNEVNQLERTTDLGLIEEDPTKFIYEEGIVMTGAGLKEEQVRNDISSICPDRRILPSTGDSAIASLIQTANQN